MTTQRRARSRRAQQLTLALTVVLAVALGGVMYLSVTSLPYLATSPTTDPVFGPLNACLLAAVPERLGFAVSGDGTRVAAWSERSVVECAGTPPVPTAFALSQVTLGAYDGTGALWLASGRADGGPASLLRLEAGAFVERGALLPAVLLGTAHGVVALEPSGQLVAVSTEGAVTASRELPVGRNVQLRASGDGTLVALYGGGRFAVVNAQSLESTAAEAPCPVRGAWWRPGVPLVVVECADLTVEINALNSESVLLDPRQRMPSTLIGPAGVYVQACDQLPCSVAAPR